ncbi:hypothetical protein ACIBTP_39955 [Streptomyces avidinii]|uniref:hypothetical protein n=1 Tax=Streptomyces avidinii TaxID=1895 RepID=UPI003787E6BD
MDALLSNELERELTALDVVGFISAVAGVTPVVFAVYRAWGKASRGRVGREGALAPAEHGSRMPCGCGWSVIVRHKSCGGDRVTVWTTLVATPASNRREPERGPW